MVAWETELEVVSCSSLRVRLTMEVALTLASLMMRASSPYSVAMRSQSVASGASARA